MQALTERFELRLDQETLRAVDQWRSARGASRSEAVRQLIEQGLQYSGHPPLRFSRGETLIIYTLCEMMKALKLGTEIDAKLVQSAILGGHLWGLEWEMSGLFHDHVDSRRVVRDVVDALDMWSFIEEACERFTKKEKDRIEKEIGYGPPQFVGYDGNNEVDYLGVAQFMVHQLGRFERFKTRELNSHSPRAATYSRMVEVFEPIRRTLVGHGLNVDQVIKIVQAPTKRVRKRGVGHDRVK